MRQYNFTRNVMHVELHACPMCGSRKYPYPPQGRPLEIRRRKGVSKAKIFKGKYEAKLEIPGGVGWGREWGFKPKSLPLWRYGYFLEPHNRKINELRPWKASKQAVEIFHIQMAQCLEVIKITVQTFQIKYICGKL